jgi:hypothetical protein
VLALALADDGGAPFAAGFGPSSPRESPRPQRGCGCMWGWGWPHMAVNGEQGWRQGRIEMELRDVKIGED